jgi:hypothetical protein
VAPTARREGAVVLVTLGLAWATSFAARSAFAARYLAVVVPLVVLVAAMGLTAIGSDRWRRIVAVVVLGGLAVGVVAEVSRDRTQAGAIADAVVRVADEDGATAGAEPLLVICPDQNGPSVQRAVRERGGDDRVEMLTYPELDDPRFVDWVDYEDRNAAADPGAVAAEVLRRAEGRPLLLATTGGYQTLEGQCEALAGALAAGRGQPTVLVAPEERNEDEPAIELYRYPTP